MFFEILFQIKENLRTDLKPKYDTSNLCFKKTTLKFDIKPLLLGGFSRIGIKQI